METPRDDVPDAGTTNGNGEVEEPEELVHMDNEELETFQPVLDTINTPSPEAS